MKFTYSIFQKVAFLGLLQVASFAQAQSRPIGIFNPLLSDRNHSFYHMNNHTMGPEYLVLPISQEDHVLSLNGIAPESLTLQRLEQIVPSSRRNLARVQAQSLIGRDEESVSRVLGSTTFSYSTNVSGDIVNIGDTASQEYFLTLFGEDSITGFPIVNSRDILPFETEEVVPVQRPLPYGDLVAVRFVPRPTAVTAQLARSSAYPLGVCLRDSGCGQVPGFNAAQAPLAAAVNQLRLGQGRASAAMGLAAENPIAKIRYLDVALASDLANGGIAALEYYFSLPVSTSADTLISTGRRRSVTQVFASFQGALRNARHDERIISRAGARAATSLRRLGFQSDSIDDLIGWFSTSRHADRLNFVIEQILLSSLEDSNADLPISSEQIIRVRVALPAGGTQ